MRIKGDGNFFDPRRGGEGRGFRGLRIATLIVIHVTRTAIVVIKTGWPGAVMCI